MAFYEIVSEMLLKNSFLDNLRIALPGEEISTGIPGILKVTLGLIERALFADHKKLIFILPDGVHAPFLIVVLQTMSDIINGNLGTSYDINHFVKGQKLKIKNCVCEFDRTGYVNGKTLIYVNFSDVNYGCPLDIAPFFQFTDTSRRLSKYARYAAANKEIDKLREGAMYSIKYLKDYKTHLTDTIFFVSRIGNSRGLFMGLNVNDEPLTELVLAGQLSESGNIETIGKGQLAGNHAITLTNDIYYVNEMIDQGAPTRMVFVDGTNENIIDNQLEAIDEIIYNGLPVICLVDTARSFDMKTLTDREFKTFRWDENSIPPELYLDEQLTMSKITANCAKCVTEYVYCDNKEIAELHKHLNKLRAQSQDYSLTMLDVFWQIYNLALFALRNTLKLDDLQSENYLREIRTLESKVKNQYRFLSPEEVDKYNTIFNRLKVVFSKGYLYSKAKAMEHNIINACDEPVSIIIPENYSKALYLKYWIDYCSENNIIRNIRLLYPEEFYNNNAICEGNVVVSGWLRKNIMRKILHSNLALKYTVLLCGLEVDWQRSHQRQWKKIIKNESNRKFAEDILKIILPVDREEPEINISGAFGELDDIEDSIRDSKYRKYSYVAGSSGEAVAVEAIPVHFTGGRFAFFRLSKKLITATGIISGKSKKIREILPESLETGEFVVFRESGKSIIRDIADEILNKKGISELRALSGRWKKKLIEERFFNSIDKLHKKLQNEGCTIGLPQFRNWIEDDDFIAPRSKDDLFHIANAFNDAYLADNLEKIYEASKEVRVTHQKAGRILSERLKSQIAEKLGDADTLDPQKIWEPVILFLDNIGNVKILKVMDISPTVTVDSGNTNRLFIE